MRPYDANTFEKVCKLERDHYDTEDYWILLDGAIVTLCAQKIGENSTQKINIPRADFNRLVSWYMREQLPKMKKMKNESTT